MAVLNAVSTDANVSADFAVSAGTPVTLCLVTGSDATLLPDDSKAQLQWKSAGGFYRTVAELTKTDNVGVLDAPGTYRVVKGPAGVAFGVDKT